MESLMAMIEEKHSHTGYEVEQIVNAALESLDNDEVELARSLKARYFGADNEYKPLKFVFYRLIKTKQGEWSMRRNLYLSPRAAGYYDTAGKAVDPIHEMVRTHNSVKGADLKEYVEELAGVEFEFPEKGASEDTINAISYENLSKQLAAYIKEFFIDCEKPIKDDVWYCISCREYGTATVYRDLTKSPRKSEQ